MAPGAQVVNGYLGGSLNRDEADEMNLYSSNAYDMPYGPSDLEWLYRLQDVDGATLTSRLSKLAPVSFLNPADGLTRRRLFSTDSWEPTGFVYANDNPSPYAGAAYNILGHNNVAYSATTDHNFAYNSRFTPTASPSLEIMNQIDGNVSFPQNRYDVPVFSGNFANPITTEYLPNPTFPPISPLYNTSAGDVIPSSGHGARYRRHQPLRYVPAPSGPDDQSQHPRQWRLRNTMVQVQTPSLAHRDRKINLNMPLPISNDPGEPVRQKWCRETYQMLKAILPPASVDTPEELAALSQFVVNIIDFRDPDCTMTRFVNTDLIVTDVLTKTPASTNDPADPAHRSRRRRPTTPPGTSARPVSGSPDSTMVWTRIPPATGSLPTRHLTAPTASRTSPTTRASTPRTPPPRSSSSMGWNTTRSRSTRFWVSRSRSARPGRSTRLPPRACISSW